MSLIGLYSKHKTALATTKRETYQEFVFAMERSGVNDLVAKNMVDPTFRPPTAYDTYIQALFKEGVIANQL